MKQSEHFLKGEGDKWYARNHDKAAPDHVLDQWPASIPVGNGTKVLEIGCGDGKRLSRLNARYECKCWGIEPSAMAVHKSPPWMDVKQGRADDLPYTDGFFDIVIFGFLLYLVDREDLFKVAYEADRVLKDGGHIIIQDFWPDQPHSRIYKHNTELRSYKMDYSDMFLWNPAYKTVDRVSYDAADDRTVIVVMHKNMAEAFPLRDLE